MTAESLPLDGAHYPVVIIGGGQAGLSMSYCLKQKILRTLSSRKTASATRGGVNAGTVFVWSRQIGNARYRVFCTAAMIRKGSC